MRILISGASIAGPALAYWLGHAGHDVTVVELAPVLRRGGYAVDIRGPALAVIERMGLREVCRGLETDTRYNEIVDARGRRFGRMKRGFGVIDPGDVEIHRGDLAGVFYDATRDIASYRFGDSILALDDAAAQGGDRVDVAFASGAVGTFDLVIGADGVHSRTRELAFGPEANFVRELGLAMAIFSAPNDYGLDREQLLYSAIGRVASVKTAAGNATVKLSTFFSVEPGTFAQRSIDEQRELAARAFADAGWEFPRLVEAIATADDFYADVTCQVRMDAFVRGRVALVGDAAYCPSPLSGQGTSLAIVGAYVLAAELRGGDVAGALAAYQRRMLPFARANQDVALELAKGFMPHSGFGVWMRNLMMRTLPYMPWSSLVMKLAMRGVRRAAHGLELDALPAPVSTALATAA
ncbi:MAG TPA: FAD-dependent monooxygenase [Kofleriaceae bacterium]|jgi:2-polyprenyl-6-methoxyphenol hydroxylase-like FAD-dependent oxidoreductase